MKKYFLLLISVLLFSSCITDKSKSSIPDIYETYKGEEGFVILKLPPVLFQIFIKEGEKDTEWMKDVDIYKVLFFEESEKSIGIDELKSALNGSIAAEELELLLSVRESDSTISVYFKQEEDFISNVFFLVEDSKKSLISVELSGKMKPESLMSIANSLDLHEIKNYE